MATSPNVETVNVGKERKVGLIGAEKQWNEEFPEGPRAQNGHGGPVITPKQKSQSNEINKEGL